MIAKRLQFARIMAMGHTRLGKIPTTKRWREVVATLQIQQHHEVELKLANRRPSAQG
jgi:hypothetical protein